MSCARCAATARSMRARAVPSRARFRGLLERFGAHSAALRTAPADRLPRSELAANGCCRRVSWRIPGALPSGGRTDAASIPRRPYDLCVASGRSTRSTIFRARLLAIRFALKPDSLAHRRILGRRHAAAPCGQQCVPPTSTSALPARTFIRVSSLRAFAQLLTAAGFTMPVVDVDRVMSAIAALPTWSATFVRWARPTFCPQGRAALNPTGASAAAEAFRVSGRDGRVTRAFEILHFAAWTPAK